MPEPHRWMLIAAALWAVCGPRVGCARADDVQVNTYTTGIQRWASVALRPAGDFIVVWTSEGSVGDPWACSIQGQRFAASGSPLGVQFQVNTYTTDGQYRSAVALDTSGAFVVVWDSYGSGGTDSNFESIQGQRYASDGSPLGVQFQVNTYTPGEQYAPSVALSTAGDFVVVWGSYLYDYKAPVFSIQGQRYASDGTPAGVEFQVNTYTTGTRGVPSVASSADGDFVVVWHSFGTGGTDSSSGSIQAQRYASDGFPVAGEFQVNTFTPSRQWLPSVASSANGDFVVVWESSGSSGTDSSSTSIQGQRYASDGSPMGGEFQVNTFTPNGQGFPAVALDAAGNFAVTWNSNGSSGTDSSDDSIQGRRYASDGFPVAGEFQVNTFTTSDQMDPSVALGAAGEWIVVWTSNGSGGTDTNASSIQRTAIESIFADGFESGDTSAWSTR